MLRILFLVILVVFHIFNEGSTYAIFSELNEYNN